MYQYILFSRYLNDLPLDDETEEQLYIRERIAAKLGEINSKSKSEANGKIQVHPNALRSPSGNVSVPNRRIDLSSSKFRMSQRRVVDRSSSEYESKVSRLSERASVFGAKPSSNDEVATTTTCENRRRTRNDRQTSTTDECEPVRVNDDECTGKINGCGIQIGPSVNIERELTKQHLENVHISPNPSYMHNCANTAIYICTSANNGLHRKNDQSARLAMSRPEKRGKPSDVGVATNATLDNAEKNVVPVVAAVIRDSDHAGENDGHNPLSRNMKDATEMCKDDTRVGNEVMETSKFRSEYMVINEKDNDIVDLKKTDNRRLKVNFCDNAENRCMDNNKNAAFNQAISGADDRQNSENIVDRDNRSKELLSTTGISRELDEDESIVSHYQAIESFDIQPRGTINEHFLNAEYPDDSPTKDNWHEINLYKPHLDDVDSILHSNDKKIERLIHVTQSFTDLLSKPEFSKYKLHNDEPISLHHHRELPRKLSVDKNRKASPVKSARLSTIVRTEVKDENFTVANTYRANVNPLGGMSTETTTNSSNLTARTAGNDYRSSYSKNSIESTLYPTSDASIQPSNVSRNTDEDQRLTSQEEHLKSKSAVDKTCRGSGDRRHRERNINDTLDHLDVDQFAADEINNAAKRYPDDVSSQESPQHLTTDMSVNADRFILHTLQDNKRREIARKGSAILPSRVTRKPPTNLRRSKLISSARQLETKKISRSAHEINYERPETDENIDNKDTNDHTKISENTLVAFTVHKDTNVLSSVIEEKRQIEGNINSREFGQSSKESYDIKCRDEYSSNFSECCETPESVRSYALGSASSLNSKDNIKSKNDSCSDNGKSLKQISDHRSDEDENPGVTLSEANVVSARSNDESNARQSPNEINNERQKYKSDNERNNRDHSVVQNRYTDKNIVETTIIDQIRDAQLSITRDIPILKEKEITIDKIPNNSNVSSTESMGKISGIKGDLQSTATSNKSKSLDETVNKEDPSHLSENIKSMHAIEKNQLNDSKINSQCINKEMINHTKSCSFASQRDCTSLHTLLSSTKNIESSMKNIVSCDKKTSLNDMMNESIKNLRIANDGNIQSDSVTIMEIERARKHEDKITEISQDVRKDKEQYLTNSGDILPKFISGSNSSISSISLDRDSK